MIWMSHISPPGINDKFLQIYVSIKRHFFNFVNCFFEKKKWPFSRKKRPFLNNFLQDKLEYSKLNYIDHTSNKFSKFMYIK
jgi:hypothetical protein